MAYRVIPIYNLDAPVGPKKANRPDDVKLVQSLLRLAIKNIPEGNAFETPQVTGSFDEKTRVAIVLFQRWMAEAKNIKRDDVLDPMPAKRGGVDFETMGPNGHIYSIYYLNIMARRISPGSHEGIGRQLGLQEAAGFRSKLPIL